MRRSGLKRMAATALLAVVVNAAAATAQAPPRTESDRLQIAGAEAACRAGDFGQFLFLFAQSSVVRARYVAANLEVGAEGRSRQVTQATYLARHRFPIQAMDYSLFTAASADAWERSGGRTGQLEHIVSVTNSAADNRRRIDWSRAIFVDEGGEGPGRPTALVGQAGALLFRPTADCWALAGDYRPSRRGSLTLADVQRR